MGRDGEPWLGLGTLLPGDCREAPARRGEPRGDFRVRRGDGLSAPLWHQPKYPERHRTMGRGTGTASCCTKSAPPFSLNGYSSSYTLSSKGRFSLGPVQTPVLKHPEHGRFCRFCSSDGMLCEASGELW